MFVLCGSWAIRGSQHMFNELQRTNTVTADNGIPNGNVNSGSGSGGAVNGVTATATTTTATTAAAIATTGPTASGSALRINSNDPGDLTNINKSTYFAVMTIPNISVNFQWDDPSPTKRHHPYPDNPFLFPPRRPFKSNDLNLNSVIMQNICVSARSHI